MPPVFLRDDMMGSWKIVPDESTRCGCLVLYVTKYVKTEFETLCDYLTEVSKASMITWDTSNK